MHKQDTARLNAQAVGDRLRALGLKQYMVARQVGVEPLTVNRWLTGKVKRISRDNLSRLALVLQCPENELYSPDEADVAATRVEQSQAAKLLIEPRARQIFERTGDYALYEKLLKAIMHPNMTVPELCELYMQLALAAARQSNHEQTRTYARLGLEYARRGNDAYKEFQAQLYLAAARGELGELAAARRELEQLVSLAENSQPARAVAVSRVNLIHVYWLLADFRKAIQTANICIPMLPNFVDTTNSIVFAITESARVARELGWFTEARRLKHQSLVARGEQRNDRTNSMDAVFHADIDSLSGDTAGAAVALDASLETFYGVGRFVEDTATSPARILRRAGRLKDSAAYLEWAFAQPWLGAYDPPFLYAEQARLEAGRGDWRGARKSRREANTRFAGLGMSGWVHDDPAVEVGSQFTAPARLRFKI